MMTLNLNEKIQMTPKLFLSLRKNQKIKNIQKN